LRAPTAVGLATPLIGATVDLAIATMDAAGCEPGTTATAGATGESKARPTGAGDEMAGGEMAGSGDAVRSIGPLGPIAVRGRRVGTPESVMGALGLVALPCPGTLASSAQRPGVAGRRCCVATAVVATVVTSADRGSFARTFSVPTYLQPSMRVDSSAPHRRPNASLVRREPLWKPAQTAILDISHRVERDGAKRDVDRCDRVAVTCG
jgi:hypothetical protein